MARLRGPLLGFKAQGSIGSNVTFRETKGQDIALKIPTHPDARTLAQVYQRWRYYDAVQYYRSRSAAQIAAYRTQGVRRHLTAYQECMRQYLLSPADQVLWLTLDTAPGAVTPDRSGQDNHGTLYGPSQAAGKIDRCFLFDGIDDHILCGNDTSLAVTGDATWTFWLNRTSYIYHAGLLSKWASYEFDIHQYTDNTLGIFQGNGDDYDHITWAVTTSNGIWYHIAIRRVVATKKLRLYINGAQHGAEQAYTKTVAASTKIVSVGRRNEGTDQPWHGLLDDDRIYTRALTDEHIHYIATFERWPEAPAYI